MESIYEQLKAKHQGVVLKWKPERQEKSSHANIWRKSILDRGNICKGPEVGMSLVCLRKRNKDVMSEEQ